MTRSPRRTAGAVVATLGLILSVVGLLAPPASADSHGDSPPGNNGTIKVDEQGIENGPGAPNSNDPKITCVGRVEYYGIDEGEQDTQLVFEVHPPTLGTAPDGTNAVKTYEATITGNGPGGPELDGYVDFDLTDLLEPYEPHPRQGYHVKVTTHTTFSQGADTKHKVFWVQPCEGDEDDFGALQVTKDATGDGQPDPATLFGFTVACTHDNEAVDLTDDDATTTASFSLADSQQSELFDLLPVGATCTITETEDHDADTTTWLIDGEPVLGEDDQPLDTDTITVVIEGATTIAVVAVNDFGEEVGSTGGLSVIKQVTGNDPPPAETAFGVRVSCTVGEGEPVDLNGDDGGNDVTFTRTAAQAAFPVSGIPTGATCTVTETEDHDADDTIWLRGETQLATGASVQVTIGADTTVALIARNVFNTTAPPPDTGSLSIDKVVDGDDVPVPGTRFAFEVTCLSGGVAVDLNGDAAGTTATFTLTANQAERVLSGIPTGATCTVTETDDRGAAETSWTVDGDDEGTGDSVSGIVIGDGTTVAVVATNLFEEQVGGVVITRPAETPRAPVVVPSERPREAVLGNVVQRQQLPRTGDEPLPLLELGLGLLALGIGLSWSGRRRGAAAI